MSNTPVKVAFAFLVILTCPTASYARHFISATMKNAPIPTINRNAHAKCVQGNPTAATPQRPDGSVCWAPQDTDDVPDV